MKCFGLTTDNENIYSNINFSCVSHKLLLILKNIVIINKNSPVNYFHYKSRSNGSDFIRYNFFRYFPIFILVICVLRWCLLHGEHNFSLLD